jgi:hypothetical protein
VKRLSLSLREPTKLPPCFLKAREKLSISQSAKSYLTHLYFHIQSEIYLIGLIGGNSGSQMGLSAHTVCTELPDVPGNIAGCFQWKRRTVSDQRVKTKALNRNPFVHGTNTQTRQSTWDDTGKQIRDRRKPLMSCHSCSKNLQFRRPYLDQLHMSWAIMTFLC